MSWGIADRAKLCDGSVKIGSNKLKELHAIAPLNQALHIADVERLGNGAAMLHESLQALQPTKPAEERGCASLSAREDDPAYGPRLVEIPARRREVANLLAILAQMDGLVCEFGIKAR
jgi:hypothetical protein